MLTSHIQIIMSVYNTLLYAFDLVISGGLLAVMFPFLIHQLMLYPNSKPKLKLSTFAEMDGLSG